MVNIKISSDQLSFLHNWARELDKACGCHNCGCKKTDQDIHETIEKAFHSISEGHREHELSFSDGAVAFMHDGLVAYQKEHQHHMSNDHKEMLSSLIEVFSK